MPKTLTSKMDRSISTLAVLMFVITFLVTALIVPHPSRATSRFSCTLSRIGGETRTLSCGSSAGNFIFVCDRRELCLDETNNTTNQSFANLLCEGYERNGCPPPLEGNPVLDLTEITQ
jgi:hypothetical protein